jgi:DNA-binding MarR family transcriptional regulator
LSSDLSTLARDLSRRWHELGRVLSSRKLLASLHAAPDLQLTPTKLRALDVVAEGDVRVGQLASRVGVDDTTATRFVDRLVESGLVERRSSPEDRRATVVALTDAGEALMRRVAEERQKFFADVLHALDPDEREELVRLTAKAAGALRTKSDELIAR